MTTRTKKFGIHGASSRRKLRLLRHIAGGDFRTEAAIQNRFGTVGLDHLAAFKREGLVEYHSVETYAYRITAAGRSALKKMTESAKKKAA